MSSIFGWDLPPGTTQRHIDEMYGPEPPPPPRCARCGRFLPVRPERSEPWEDGIECDGKTVEYEMPYTSGVIAILGDEFEGKTYTERLAPCGECVDHAPHKDIMAAGVRVFRRCRCGHVTEMEE